MATTKKKPSAAQIAARKLFAERAKAGTLKKEKRVKSAAKEYSADMVKNEKGFYVPKRAKNPIKSVRHDYAPKFQVGDAVHLGLRKAGGSGINGYIVKFEGDKVYIQDSEGKLRRGYTENLSLGHAGGAFKKNPIAKPKTKVINRTPRTKNVMFAVHRSDWHGKPIEFIAQFQSMEKAKEYAHSYANAYMCSTLVETKYY